MLSIWSLSSRISNLSVLVIIIAFKQQMDSQNGLNWFEEILLEWRKYTWLNKQGQMNERREYTWLTHSKRHFLLILSGSCCSTMLESQALGHRPFSYHEMWAAIVLVPWQEFFPFIKHICNKNNLFIGYPNLFGSSFVIIVDIRRTSFW